VVSLSGLSFEIMLTRLFSLLFQYHFAFLALSIAVFGVSIGAALASFTRYRDLSQALPLLSWLLQGMALSMALVVVLLSRLTDTSTVYPGAALALIPFVFVGLFFGVAFRYQAGESGTLYAADLIGAAAGAVVALLLLTFLSPFTVVLSLAVVVAGAGVGLALVARGAGRGASPSLLTGAGAALVVAALWLVTLTTGALDYQPQRIENAPRDKTMLAILGDPRQNAAIMTTAYSPLARVDVVAGGDPAERYVFTDAGAGSYMMRLGDDPRELAWLGATAEYLPLTIAPTDAEALIIGAGGGRDIVLALLAGVEGVTAVEVNPAVVEVTRRFADYNGNILDRPEVDLIVGNARSVVERATQQFGLIYLNLVYTQAVSPAGQALVENYIFTTEAFASYLAHLTPDGKLAVVSHNALEGSRAALTALQALETLGVPAAQGLDHLLLWMVPNDDPTRRTTVMVISASPLDRATIDRYSAEARARGMQPIYIPGDAELFFAPLRRGGTVADFVDADADYDLSPTVDDSPYFFQLDFGLPPTIADALRWSAALAAVVGAFALVWGGVGRRRGNLGVWLVMLLYAAAIGAGFMLLEIALIQRFQLVFDYPLVSLAAVLATLLLAGGLGSLASQRWLTSRLAGRVAGAALVVVLLAVVYGLFLPPLVAAVLAGPAVVRALLVLGLTALLGLPLGVLFPSLLRLAGERFPARVPLLWAVNGAFAVLGSTLAVVISMQWGFSWALLAGAGLYLLVSLLALGPLRRWAV
jgi:SAM-dependent methyltransferase